jgi:hypothetical protein
MGAPGLAFETRETRRSIGERKDASATLRRSQQRNPGALPQAEKKSPDQLKSRLKLSWSNWEFGREPLADSAARLAKSKVPYIELHGNHYGPDLGYKVDETLKILGDNGIKVSGVCGMFSADNDLAFNRAVCRQAAIDYLDREVPFTRAVGRPKPCDDVEFERSAETLAMRGDLFVKHGIKAAIEPIRSAEVSLVHTIADAKRYLAQVNHSGVGHINGDVYHMQSEERHIGDALLDAGSQLVQSPHGRRQPLRHGRGIDGPGDHHSRALRDRP